MSRDRRRGSMLIIALAVLTLLSIIAVTFAALMRLERKATENFVNATSVDMLATSAESSVIAMLRGGTFWDGFTDPREGRSPWLYGLKSSRGDLRYGGLLPLVDTPPEQTSFAADLGATYGGAASSDRYRVKLIDCNSQIFINGEQDTIAQMLDTLGEALRRDSEIQIDPLNTEPKESGKKLSGRDILLYRSKLPGQRFATKAQLKDLIGEENFLIISDYVTAHAWENPYTYRAGDGSEPVRRSLEGDAFTAGIIDPNPLVEQPPNLLPESRAPINVNTASRPVLIACLKGLGGRRAFPYTEVSNRPFEDENRGAIDIETGTLPPTQEEFRLLQFPIWYYSQPLSFESAEQIADEIIRARKVRPFKVWRSGNQLEPGFEEFINQLPETIFPPPTTARVVNPRDKTNSNRYRAQNTDGSQAMWNRGHSGSERGVRRQAGLAVSGANAWYYDMMRDTLKANFNPNTRINKYNPNGPAYVAVDKANLVKLANDGTDDSGLEVGHTTDFCFDSKGIYEITSVAEILVGDDPANVETFAETQRRSVVKVFDVLHQTTQQQFEEPFNEGGRSSFRDRLSVTTFPFPMDAMHPDYYFGSTQDGRVELSGSTDAERGQLRPELRNNVFQQQPNVKLAHDFRYRDPQNMAQLERRLQSGGRGSDEVRQLLAQILDPAYSQAGAQFRYRYSRDRWSGAKDAEDELENIDEPIVGAPGDLQPDGLHMSFMRVPRTGTRILRFPASRYREGPLSQGEIGPSYQNDLKNLPYYQGGVSFWIKPEFDGQDPIFSGILKTTQVQTRVGQGPEDSEGTQFFVWKNTSGELRVTRLYYHQAFFRDQPNQAYPLIGDDEELEGEDFETDARKAWARTDVIVDVRDWKAHEWHHVVVQFDDDADANRVQVRIDGEPLDFLTNHNIGLGRFVALNEEEPKDEIMIGGIYRNQAVAGQGIFKFGGNVAQRSMQEFSPSVKKVPVNATIDEFRTFLGFYDGGNRELGYYTREQGTYTNRFEVPFPEGIQRVRLRSLTWSVYPPTMYAGLPVRWIPEQDFEFSVAGPNRINAFVPLGDPASEAERNPRVAGQWLYPSGSLFGRTGTIAYQVKMKGALGSQKYGDRIVASPVLDDVTMTYYLPSAQILLSEGID